MNINDMLGNEPVMQDRSPEGQIFAIEAEMKNLMEEYDVAARSGDQQRADAINNQIEKLQDIMIEIQNEMSNEGRGDIYNLSTPNIYNSRLRQSLESGDPDEIRKNQEDIKRSALQDIQSIEMSGMMEEYPNDSAKKIEELKRYSMNMGGEASSQHMMPDGTPMPGSNHEEYEAMMMQQRQMMAGGGTPFPDLTGDGKITQADILKGRGVYAVGGEAIGDELEGMEMTEEQAMAELEESRGEFEQLQMLADVVKKLLNEGMGEAEIVAYLKEQGLDDEDIETLFSFLQEISGQESSMEQAPQGIDQQLQGMM